MNVQKVLHKDGFGSPDNPLRFEPSERRHSMSSIAIAASLGVLLSVPLSAQWLGFREPGILRTADGKPDLKAPLPRMPDGKPDLSGLWEPQASPYRF
jgi:hypothetical protein